MPRILRSGLLFLLLACLWAAPAPLRLSTAHAQDAGLNLREAERSVVRVLVLHLDANDQPISMVGGTGFVVAPGKVVTNFHVVQPPEGASRSLYYVVPDKFAGTEGKDAQLVQSWQEADLALLDAPLITAPPLKIAATPPGKEATVRALGYPGVTDRMRNLPLEKTLQPSEPYVTSGSIALFSDTAPGGGAFETIFHTAPIDHGNSGGPLVDECDRVIGVNTWGASDTLADNGSVESHQGQFAAIRSTVVGKFLDTVGVKVALDYSPCVKTPPVDPALVEQVNRANAAAAAAVAAAKKAEDERDRTVRWGAIGLGVFALLLAIFLIVRSRQNPAPYSNAHVTPQSVASVHGEGNDAAAAPAPTLVPPSPPPPPSKPIPVAVWILLAVVIGAAVVFWMTSHPKAPAADTPPPPQALNLQCTLVAGRSFNAPAGSGSLGMKFDPSTACVNDRTPYEPTATGYVRIMVSDKQHTASRLELSKDLKTFTRHDYALSDSDYAAFQGGRQSIGPIVCPTPGDAPSAKTTADALNRVRALSASYLETEPTRVVSWKCAQQPVALPAPATAGN